jgi:hypothetical protein
MAAPSPRARLRAPPLVLWALALALMIGVAAAILSAPTPHVAPGAVKPVYVTFQELTDAVTIVLIVLLAILGWYLWNYQHRVPGVYNRFAVFVLEFVILGVVFILVAGLVHPGPAPCTPNCSSPGGVGAGGSGTPGGSNTTGNNSTTPPTSNGTSGGFLAVHVPPWAIYTGVLAAGLLLLLLATPRILQYWEDRHGGTDLELSEEEARAAER